MHHACCNHGTIIKCRVLSGPKILRGNMSKAGLTDNLGIPKGVGVRWGFVPSHAKRGKLKHSFILGFTKSHLSNTLDPIKSNEQGTKNIAKPNTDMRIVSCKFY